MKQKLKLKLKAKVKEIDIWKSEATEGLRYFLNKSLVIKPKLCYNSIRNERKADQTQV